MSKIRSFKEYLDDLTKIAMLNERALEYTSRMLADNVYTGEEILSLIPNGQLDSYTLRYTISELEDNIIASTLTKRLLQYVTKRLLINHKTKEVIPLLMRYQDCKPSIVDGNFVFSSKREWSSESHHRYGKPAQHHMCWMIITFSGELGKLISVDQGSTTKSLKKRW